VSGGAIAQPTNTWTSVAYVVAGALIIARRRAWRLQRSALIFGLLVITVGAGSVAFHATEDSPGHWLHDISIVGLVAFITGYEMGRLLRRCPGIIATATAAGSLVVVGALLVAHPDATNVVVALLVLVATAAYAVARARGGGRAAWSDAPLVVLAVLAGAAFVLGRTGSPACAAGSWFQFHGLWHVATAVLAVMWAATALRRSEGSHGDRLA
jgi:Ceramidase